MYIMREDGFELLGVSPVRETENSAPARGPHRRCGVTTSAKHAAIGVDVTDMAAIAGHVSLVREICNVWKRF